MEGMRDRRPGDGSGRCGKDGVTAYRVTVAVLVLLLVFLAALLLGERKKASSFVEADGAGLRTVRALGSAARPALLASGTVPAADAGRAATEQAGMASASAGEDAQPRRITPAEIYNPIPDIFDAVSPGVVGVLNYGELAVGEEKILSVYGTGTGFIVSTDGYVLTNAHVVENAAAVSVRLSNGSEIDAKVIGADKETDVAVLRIDAAGLTPLPCGDSDAVRVGEFCLAIGNPVDSERLANTLTFGIISATAREVTIDSYTNVYLQTDAAINFGNSGGPLLNLRGEVIGINSAKSITAGYDSLGNPVAAEGIGFALPINSVLRIMEELILNGSIRRPGVGITVSTVTDEMAKKEGVPYGAYVESIVPGAPADIGGVRPGDIITAIDGKEVREHSELVTAVKEHRIGDVIELRIWRGGETLTLRIELANKTEMDFDKSVGAEPPEQGTPLPEQQAPEEGKDEEKDIPKAGSTP